MNPDRIWRELANDALAEQIVADRYGVFVAMPFRDQFSYHADAVFEQVMVRAVDVANERLPGRKFSRPVRADLMGQHASEITEDIVEGILRNHFFVADLTLANHGVLVELGIALALKSTKSIMLLAQGDLRDLHFDLKDNRVISYDRDNWLENVVDFLVRGAEAFEQSVGNRMALIKKTLSSEAVYLLNLNGRRRLAHAGNSLHSGISHNDVNLATHPTNRELVFKSAIRELLQRGLIYLDYQVGGPQDTGDMLGLHATPLGLTFIRLTWPRDFANLQ